MKAFVVNETNQHLLVQINKPSLRYLNEFVGLKCAGDLLDRGLFPNVKEITESMAAYHAVRKYLWKQGYHPSSDKVSVVCVGDGHTPRTAALFAMRSKWQCYSIDPVLRPREWDIRNLFTEAKKVEDTTLVLHEYDKVIVVAVHSHANLSTAWRRIKPGCPVIAIPCCIPQNLIVEVSPDVGAEKILPSFEYEDYGILSPKRTVKVWL